jgi:hypothetical protein
MPGHLQFSPKYPTLLIILKTQVEDIVYKYHSPELAQFVSTNTNRNCTQLSNMSNFISNKVTYNDHYNNENNNKQEVLISQ